MSELKRRNINEVMDMFCLTKGDLNWSQVYYADEADKVIAELEETHKKEVGQLLAEIAELKSQVHEMAGKVYVVIEFDSETLEFSEIEGVFQSKEEAEDFAKDCNARYLRYSYECFEETLEGR
jgi:nitrate reductase NapAB chaperone NapD